MVFPPQKIVTYYTSRLPPRESPPFTYPHITGSMSQTNILGDSGSIRELDEIISCDPWVPSNTETSECAQPLCLHLETIAIGQPLAETHFESGDQISPALLVRVWVQRVLCWSSSRTITVKPGTI